ncbi:MAG TPA: NAD-dependent epimerase/dehydratase family protein [Patescibacteria group bacterium]|nr:NAD-dependent epimerase/dehydratase family protein [Patescibacteria group bacterium]
MAKTAFITGAGGEVGFTLVHDLKKRGYRIIASSLHDLEPELKKNVDEFYAINISDKKSLSGVFEKHNFDVIFHLASILSTGGEKNPELAIEANTIGSINMLELAAEQTLKRKKSVIFIFPSTIAAYGLPDLATKKRAGSVKEGEFSHPITIYGVTKIFTENLGVYFSEHYRLLDNLSESERIDFRCVKYPGLLSPDTLPSGGTSDYGSEMIHNAVQGKDFECFVRPDTKIPFMAMEDAVRAIITLSETPKNKLKHRVYNISGFSVSAEEIAKEVISLFPGTKITYQSHGTRQGIVDSWPEDIDDSKAKEDWGWEPKYTFKKTFEEYLLPKIKERYKVK